MEAAITTIAYKDGILAGDRRVTIDRLVLPERVRKVHRLRDGRLFGYSGDWTLYEAVLAHFRDPTLECPPIRDKVHVILVLPDGRAYSYENNALIPVGQNVCIARGSGMDAAYGAMFAGATAIEAVKIAARLDTGTGGGVDYVRLRK